jgi:hypothetical protein
MSLLTSCSMSPAFCGSCCCTSVARSASCCVAALLLPSSSSVLRAAVTQSWQHHLFSCVCAQSHIHRQQPHSCQHPSCKARLAVQHVHAVLLCALLARSPVYARAMTLPPSACCSLPTTSASPSQSCCASVRRASSTSRGTAHGSCSEASDSSSQAARVSLVASKARALPSSAYSIP